MKTKFQTASCLALSLTALALAPMRAMPEGAARRIEVVAQRFDFTPGEITLKKGVPVVIAFTSKDVSHGLKFKEINLVIQAKKGETSEITFTPLQVGTFVGQCSVFCGSGHGSMKMTLRVTE